VVAGRLAAALDWLATERGTGGLPVGLFGASTGAGAALLVVGGRDRTVLALNRAALEGLARPAGGRARRQPPVPGARCLELVAELATS
jgi:hypothetical protein